VRVTFLAVAFSAAVVSLAASPQKPAPPAGPSRAFLQLFDQYRRGSPAPAIGSFARWTEDRVKAEAMLPPGVDDSASLQALALFHTDAGIANDRFGMFAAKSPNYLMLGGWGLESVFEVHSLTAYRTVETLIARGKATNDLDLLRFAQQWYIVALSFCTRGGEPVKVENLFPQKPTLANLPAEETTAATGRPHCVLGLKDKAQHYFDDDPEVQLLLGSLVEPRVMRRSVLENTKVEVTYGQEARWYFKKALEGDPSLIEAAVRRARVLHIGLNYPEAQPMLEHALAAARASDNTFIAHLAAFSLGQLHEDHDEMETAIRYYREAVSLIRAHTASIALGQALIRTGQTTEGWLVGARMFGREGSGAAPIPDPFVLYRYAQYWQLDERLSVLRDMVRGR